MHFVPGSVIDQQKFDISLKIPPESNPDQEVVGCTVTNFASLDPSWDRINDCINVGLEIMEADLSGKVDLFCLGEGFDIVRSVLGLGNTVTLLHPSIPKTPQNQNVYPLFPHKNLQMSMDVRAPNVLTDYPALNNGKTSEIQFQRHIISDTQLLENVERKLQNIRQRWVRKVEWQIRQVLNVVDKSAPNDVIESPAFSAAGLTDLRLVFYPKGVDASSHGYCGLYLKCSDENVFVKFQLIVGKHSKLFEHFYATRGEVYGKTRFCQLETQVENRLDAELSVLNISVEILEVSHRKKDTENVLLFHRDDTYAKEEFRVLTLPPSKKVGA